MFYATIGAGAVALVGSNGFAREMSNGNSLNAAFKAAWVIGAGTFLVSQLPSEHRALITLTALMAINLYTNTCMALKANRWGRDHKFFRNVMIGTLVSAGVCVMITKMATAIDIAKYLGAHPTTQENSMRLTQEIRRAFEARDFEMFKNALTSHNQAAAELRTTLVAQQSELRNLFANLYYPFTAVNA